MSLQGYHSPDQTLPGTAEHTSGWTLSPESSPDRASSNQELSVNDTAETPSNSRSDRNMDWDNNLS